MEKLKLAWRTTSYDCPSTFWLLAFVAFPRACLSNLARGCVGLSSSFKRRFLGIYSVSLSLACLFMVVTHSLVFIHSFIVLVRWWELLWPFHRLIHLPPRAARAASYGIHFWACFRVSAFSSLMRELLLPARSVQASKVPAKMPSAVTRD